MDTNIVCEMVERLDEILDELEECNFDDELHVVLEIGHEFRDELSSHCEQ